MNLETKTCNNYVLFVKYFMTSTKIIYHLSLVLTKPLLQYVSAAEIKGYNYYELRKYLTDETLPARRNYRIIVWHIYL